MFTVHSFKLNIACWVFTKLTGELVQTGRAKALGQYTTWMTSCLPSLRMLMGATPISARCKPRF